MSNYSTANIGDGEEQVYGYSLVWLVQVMRRLRVVMMMKLKEVLRQRTMVAVDLLPPTPAEMEH